MRPPPPHRATTAHLQAVYPFVSGDGAAVPGTLIGRDLFGGPFFFDPWELYRAGRVTNPNAVVMGQIGRGKSTFIKSLVWRQVGAGRRAWIVDPKGEYSPLARACGSVPVCLAPGGAVRLNPLDLPAGVLEDGSEAPLRPRVELISSLLTCSLRRPLAPEERSAVELAVRQALQRRGRAKNAPTLTDVVGALLQPEEGAASEVGLDSSGLASAGRVPAWELRRLIRGDLAGMFDGPTTTGIDLTAPVVVLDLSATFLSPALPLVMTCATAWLQAAVCAPDSVKRLVVIDEAWAILNDVATARWSQANFKLARARGVANIIVVHRVSDLRAAGADGSAEEKLAAGLLADSETRVVFGQPRSEAEATGALLGLGETEIDVLTRLPRGVALWRLGSRSFVVEHLLTDEERGIADTDQAMRL